MTTQLDRIALIAAVLIVAGCSGSDRYGATPVQPPIMQPPPMQPPPMQPPPTTSFTGFVRQELARMDVGGAPASVNELNFEFDDVETSFDDLLQAASGP